MRLEIHPQNPQKNRIKQVVDMLKSNQVIAYPTDSGYALGCCLENKAGLTKIKQIRSLGKRHYFTLMLKNLAHISDYALVNNVNFRLLKKVLPGTYTFILPATKAVPTRLLDNKRKTVGIRVSPHLFVRALLEVLDEPIMSVSLKTNLDYYDVDDLFEQVGAQVDCLVDMGYCPAQPTTVIDLVQVPTLIRQGLAVSDFLHK